VEERVGSGGFGTLGGMRVAVSRPLRGSGEGRCGCDEAAEAAEAAAEEEAAAAAEAAEAAAAEAAAAEAAAAEEAAEAADLKETSPPVSSLRGRASSCLAIARWSS
jgi:hypothetical protein